MGGVYILLIDRVGLPDRAYLEDEAGLPTANPSGTPS